MLKGCDVSRYQKNSVNFNNYDFVIMKASEGVSLKDAYLDIHYDTLHGAKDGKPDKNKLYGFYHYARPEYNNPEEEAAFFLSLVGHHTGNAIFALDWEGVATSYPITWAVQWLDYVYKETGVKPLIYCSSGYTKKLKPVYEKDYGLWVAHWNVDKPNTGVYPFYAIWQYTSKPFDHDYFNGDREQFKKYCSIS